MTGLAGLIWMLLPEGTRGAGNLIRWAVNEKGGHATLFRRDPSVDEISLEPSILKRRVSLRYPKISVANLIRQVSSTPAEWRCANC